MNKCPKCGSENILEVVTCRPDGPFYPPNKCNDCGENFGKLEYKGIQPPLNNKEPTTCACGKEPLLFILFKDESLLGLCSECFLEEGEFYYNNNVMSIIAFKSNDKLVSAAIPNSDKLQERKERFRIYNNFIARILEKS